MSYRRIILSALLFGIALFTIPTLLPYLLSTTAWTPPRGAAQGQLPNAAIAKTNHLTLETSIPHEYLPTAHSKRRLIIIGDIHGMNTELGHLLDEARYNPSHDHVVALGDMVNKGPDSKGVLARLMAMNASAVRGNHEDSLLQALEEHDGRRRSKKILRLAKTLPAKQLDWLSRLPVILKAQPLQLYFVHAGLVPGVRPDKQDPWAVMNMRTLLYPADLRRKAHPDAPPPEQDDMDPRGVAVPVKDRSGEQWTKAWDRYMKRRARSARQTVMYGHDSKRGFTESSYAIGLDSACVKGGSLTALVVLADEHRPFRYTKVQVPCARAKA